MPSYVSPKKNTAFIFYAGLVSQANTKLTQVNPTIAAGDFKVSTDGGALGNLATLPTVTPAAGNMVKLSLSAGEMNGDNVTIVCIDAAGAEWCDAIFNIQTSARQVDDLAYPATTGRSMVVDAAGLVDANAVKLGASGAGTAQTARDLGLAIPAAVAGAAGGLFIAGTNAATTITTALTTTFTGNLTGSVGSVTGAVGSVTGAVGSVTAVSAGAITAASFGANAVDAAALATDAGQEIADRVLARSTAGGSDGTRPVRFAIQRLVNRAGVAAGTLTVYAADDLTASWTAAITTTAGNPVSDLDPV